MPNVESTSPSPQVTAPQASVQTLDQQERLNTAQGSHNQAAEALGISRATLWRKIKKFQL